MTKSERGILSEWQVVCDRIFNHHEALIVHRKRTPYAEIDLLLLSSDKNARLILIEVKSVAGEEIWGENLISRGQLQRLKRARRHLQVHYQRPVGFLIATVQGRREDGSLKIRYFQVTGDDF